MSISTDAAEAFYHNNELKRTSTDYLDRLYFLIGVELQERALGTHPDQRGIQELNNLNREVE